MRTNIRASSFYLTKAQEGDRGLAGAKVTVSQSEAELVEEWSENQAWSLQKYAVPVGDILAS